MASHSPNPADPISQPATANGAGDWGAAPPDLPIARDVNRSHVPVLYAHKTRLSVTIFAIVTALALVVVYFVVRHNHMAVDSNLVKEMTQAAEQPVAVDAVRVDRAAAERLLTLPGDTRSFYETTIFARTSGYLKKWFVDIGDRVKEGQVLATIENPELDDQIIESKAKLAQLKAEANVSATSAQFAKISFDRWEAAAPDGVVSAQERDQKKSELDQSLAKLEASKSAVNLGQAEVQRLQTLENFKRVVAPFEGVITERHIDIGALVTAGSTTNTTPLFTLSQSNQIRIFVDVPQPAAPGIQIGMPATATTRELGDVSFAGVVDRTASSIDPRSRTLKVEVLVPNPDLALMPGMYVQVTFKTSRHNPPLRIPAAALCFTTEGPRAAVVDARGRVSFRPVTIDRDLGYSVEISSGLSDGDLVALNVGSQVTDGEHVEAHVVEAPLNPMPVMPSRRASAQLPRIGEAKR